MAVQVLEPSIYALAVALDTGYEPDGKSKVVVVQRDAQQGFDHVIITTTVRRKGHRNATTVAWSGFVRHGSFKRHQKVELVISSPAKKRGRKPRYDLSLQ